MAGTNGHFYEKRTLTTFYHTISPSAFSKSGNIRSRLNGGVKSTSHGFPSGPSGWKVTWYFPKILLTIPETSFSVISIRSL